jgi:integrase
MANITRRTNKDGSLSYLIRIYVDDRGDGRQITKSTTWKPPFNMRPLAAEKEAQRQAILFEEKIRKGLIPYAGSTTFEDYANTWVKNEPLAPKTRDRYVELLQRVNPAIGHIKLEKLQAHHLEEFYRNLAEPGVNLSDNYATSNKLTEIMKKRKLTKAGIGRSAGISASTVNLACRGKHIRIEKAAQISAALGMDLKDAFDVHKSTGSLSEKTIHHHHQLISAVLSKAKRERLVSFNVAKEHATAPKRPHTEAKYLDDKDARLFLEAVEKEEDIRIKAALTLLLFTGVRRGELCGFSWSDFDEEKHSIYVRRAMQYQKGKGIVEVPTKNESSIRRIDIPMYVVKILIKYKKWWNEHRLMYGSAWQGEAERLFIQDNGKPINPETINGWLGRVTEKNNMPHISPHCLRHTFATLQLAAGVDIRTLQARTGHAQASTLINIYSHAIDSAQEAASIALENVLLNSGKENRA